MSRGHVNLTQAVPSLQPVPKPGTPSVQLGIAACTSNPDPPSAAFTLIWGQGELSCCHGRFYQESSKKQPLNLPVIYGFPSSSCSHGGSSASSQQAPVSCTPSTDARTAQRDPKASAHPKATLNPEERIALDGTVSIQKQWVKEQPVP